MPPDADKAEMEVQESVCAPDATLILRSLSRLHSMTPEPSSATEIVASLCCLHATFTCAVVAGTGLGAGTNQTTDHFKGDSLAWQLNYVQ